MAKISSLIVLGFLTISPAIGQTTLPKNTEAIGDFTPVNLEGWTRQFYRSNGTNAVFYRKLVGQNQITLTFGYDEDVHDGDQRIARYRSLIQAGKSMFPPSYSRGTKYKVTSEQALMLPLGAKSNYIPDVLYETTTQTPGRTEKGWVVQFAYKHKFYRLEGGMALTTPEGETRAQAALNLGWATVAKSLISSKSR